MIYISEKRVDSTGFELQHHSNTDIIILYLSSGLNLYKLNIYLEIIL